MTKSQEYKSAFELVLILAALIALAWYINENMSRTPYRAAQARFATE